MAPPKFSNFFLPVLKLAEKEALTPHTTINPLAEEFSPTPADLKITYA
jgi:hypothetical protein